MIGDNIEVKVLSVDGEKVRIGIQAPRKIPVYRLEIYLEIAQQNAAAGGSARAEVDAALERLGTSADASPPSARRVPPGPLPARSAIGAERPAYRSARIRPPFDRSRSELLAAACSRIARDRGVSNSRRAIAWVQQCVAASMRATSTRAGPLSIRSAPRIGIVCGVTAADRVPLAVATVRAWREMLGRADLQLVAAVRAFVSAG